MIEIVKDGRTYLRMTAGQMFLALQLVGARSPIASLQPPYEVRTIAQCGTIVIEHEYVKSEPEGEL